MNKAAQSLGRRAKGVPKSYTPAERERRREQMRALNRARKQKFEPSKSS